MCKDQLCKPQTEALTCYAKSGVSLSEYSKVDNYLFMVLQVYNTTK